LLGRVLSVGSTSGSPTGIGQRLFLTLFFSVFLTAGLTATVLLTRSVAKNLATYTWKPADAEILESAVTEPRANRDNPDFTVRYRYRYDGKEFTSTDYERGGVTSRNAAEAHRLAGQLSRGKRTTAYVNPAQPAEAVLHRGSLLSSLAVLFPLVFVAVGAGGIIFAWRMGRGGPESSRSNSTLRGGRSQRFAPMLLLGVFFLFGAGLSYPFFVQPLLESRAARSWPAIPCEILSSRVQTHSSNKGSTYSVEVTYRYAIDGQTYTGARYRFMSGSSSGYDGKAEVVSQLPPGTKTVCYVNPADPADVVLDRDMGGEIWIGLVPVSFALIGLIGLVSLLLRGGRAPAAAWATAGGAPIDWIKPPRTDGTGRLRPTRSRFGKLLGLLGMALFWNGIVSVFLWQVISGWKRGHHEWGTALFLSLFVAVGVGLLLLVLWQALALFNPRPQLTVSDVAIPLGGSLQINWTTDGKIDRLRNLQIFLEGREEATYRSGKNNKTDKQVFLVLPLLETTDQASMRAGSNRVRIPADTLHSFEGKNNRIVWTLKVRGEIPRWPDIDDDFPIVLLPTPLPP
jgi:hypothetical protein